jgi:hypothetical protein
MSRRISRSARSRLVSTSRLGVPERVKQRLQLSRSLRHGLYCNTQLTGHEHGAHSGHLRCHPRRQHAVASVAERASASGGGRRYLLEFSSPYFSLENPQVHRSVSILLGLCRRRLCPDPQPMAHPPATIKGVRPSLRAHHQRRKIVRSASEPSPSFRPTNGTPAP